MLRFAILVPAPDLAEPWHWAFDPEAAALAATGAAIDAIAWTEAGDLG